MMLNKTAAVFLTAFQTAVVCDNGKHKYLSSLKLIKLG